MKVIKNGIHQKRYERWNAYFLSIGMHICMRNLLKQIVKIIHKYIGVHTDLCSNEISYNQLLFNGCGVVSSQCVG